MIIEGQRVSFCGDPDGSLEVGDSGQVMQAGHTGSHIKWASGSFLGQITLVSNLDLAIMNHASLDPDVLHSGLVGFPVQAVVNQGGVGAVISAMKEEGHLASFEAIAEDCLSYVAHRVRQDPSINEVCAQLDDQDKDDLVYRASLGLLRDALRRV